MNEGKSENSTQEASRKPRVSRLMLLVSFIAAAFAAWIFIAAQSG
jgi:hypothetical protein